MEIWKDITGFEGFYKVSNYGRVKSLRFNKEKILIGDSSSGYRKVQLRLNKKIYTRFVHRLVILEFKPKLISKNFVNHIDSNSLNNHIDNLEWVDNRENMSHCFHLKNKTSKYTGVNWNKKDRNWQVNVCINRKRYYLGGFKNEEDARLAYVKKLESFSIINKYTQKEKP